VRRPPRLQAAYDTLLAAYGPQGWWPLLDVHESNPTSSGTLQGYHRGDYTYPRTDAQRFEICVGAVLTQNTAWPNVEKALRRLGDLGALSPAGILQRADSDLEEAIRPSGYFRVKTRKLRELSRAYAGFGGRTPDRDELLAIWGIGPETADSIRLYAYGQLEMVIDAYTLRILSARGCLATGVSYDDAKALCVAGLPRDGRVYQEFHALMVEHAKRRYRRRPWQDPLLGGLPLLGAC